MLSMMIAQSIPACNTWKLWVDHVTKHRDSLGFTKACIAQHNGSVSAGSSGFHPVSKEIQVINTIFREKLNNNVTTDKISIVGKTYVIKSLTATQIIAFNGSKYIIINRTKTKHVLASCESKSKYQDAAAWLSKLAQKMVEKNF